VDRNILLVTTRTPWPTSSGGQQRTFLLAEAIRGIANLHMLLVNPKPEPTASEIDVMTKEFGLVRNGILRTKSQSRWTRLFFPGRSEFGHDPVLSKSILEISRQLNCETAVFRYLPIAARSSIKTHGELIRLVDVDDVPSIRARTEADQETGLRRIVKLWSASRIKASERRAVSRTSGGWVSCEADLRNIPDGRFAILPNIPIDAAVGPASESLCEQDKSSQSILFVGAMGYSINVQAIQWFLKDVWPLVLRRKPDARIRIAGGGLGESFRKSFSAIPGVELLGYVEDLASEYQRCALSVVPISAGAGTKIKVLESLRFGRTIVLTSHSLRGYEDVLADTTDLSVADDPHRMATAITSLLGDPARRERMARHGQEVVNKHFGFEAFAKLVCDKIEESRHPC
jgi:glycosyltransferase involved in cell wall biosynthesis